MKSKRMHYTYYNSPVGKMLIAGDGDSVSELRFVSRKGSIPKEWEEDSRSFKRVIEELTNYFEGRAKKFTFKVSPQTTPFQKKVLNQLRKIPYAQTRSYGDIARAIGQPKAARAVGMANNRNPVSIAIPCHRVIGSDGKLVGYGGGLPVKKALLELEQKHYSKKEG